LHRVKAMAEAEKKKRSTKKLILIAALIYGVVYVAMYLLGSLLERFGESGQMVGFTPNLPINMANLIVLIWLLNKLLYRPILKFMEERNNRIQGMIDEAQSDRAKAKELAAEVERELARIRKESKDMLRQAREEAHQERSRLIEEADKERDAILEGAQREIRLQVEKARLELRGEIAGLAIEIAQQVVGGSLAEADLQRLAEESLAQMEGKSAL